MNKKWLIPAIAGIALMASACGNNAAPNYTTPNKTTTQSTRHMTGTDGLHVRSFDGIGRGTTYGTHHYGTRTNGMNYGPGATNYNNYNYPGTRNHTTHGTGYNTTGYGNYTGTGTGTSTYSGWGDGVRNYGTTGHHFDGFRNYGTNGVDGYRTNSFNAYTNGTRPYTAFPDGHTTGMRGHSIYQDGTHHRTGTGTTTTQAAMPHMGYVQTDRAQMQNAGNANNHVYVDREALARAVGNVTASCPGVQRSTVLVTDEEIFVGLNTAGQNAEEAKKQAKMNASSVSPRYYKVYVTNNASDIQEITRTANRTNHLQSTRATDGHHHLNALIKRMGGKTKAETKSKTSHTKSKTSHTKHVGISSR